MKILITGNVGSGKSTFLKLLKKYVNLDYYEFIDLDLITKRVIKDYNIALPEKTTNVFEDQELLFSLENKILPHLTKYFPHTNKTLIIEASTLIECPTILNSEDIIIHVSSENSIQQTLKRDKIENRAFLISKVQISKDIKNIICDYDVENNSTLDELEKKVIIIADNLNYQKTEDFEKDREQLIKEWNQNFPQLPWINDILKQYSRIDRKQFNLKYLLDLLDKNKKTDTKFSELWYKSFYLTLWFHAYEIEKNHISEGSISKLWQLSRLNNDIKNLTVGSRSFVSLSLELILALKEKKIQSNNLNYGEGMLVYHKLFSFICNID